MWSSKKGWVVQTYYSLDGLGGLEPAPVRPTLTSLSYPIKAQGVLESAVNIAQPAEHQFSYCVVVSAEAIFGESLKQFLICPVEVTCAKRDYKKLLALIWNAYNAIANKGTRGNE